MDYVDLYWMHVWDTVTPIEEVVDTLTTLVREGKIRYYGFSDVPAWYAARAQTLAQCMGREPIVALQLEYSLVERTIEREHIPAARELGMGICPWSPLASGFLAGKYTREKGADSSQGSRLEVLKKADNPAFKKFTERNYGISGHLAGGCETARPSGSAGRAQLGSDPARRHLDDHRRDQAGATR